MEKYNTKKKLSDIKKNRRQIKTAKQRRNYRTSEKL